MSGPSLATWAARAGAPIVTNPHIPEDQAFVIGSIPTAKVVVGVRRLTEAELAGRWARWFVRHQFQSAGLLPDGITVGIEPNADNVSFLATLRAEADQ